MPGETQACTLHVPIGDEHSLPMNKYLNNRELGNMTNTAVDQSGQFRSLPLL